MASICFWWAALLAIVVCSNADLDLPGLQVKTIKKPDKCKIGAEPGDHLTVHYVGRLDNEHGHIFDASRNRGQPYRFQLGAGQVIQGYEQGVPGMCKGETRTLTVPAHLAYGDQGVPSAGIPGGATLHFTVELIDVVKGKLAAPGLRNGAASEL